MMKAPDPITAIEGYDAMRVFRETVWRRHDTVEEIAFVLGSLKWADGRRRYRVDVLLPADDMFARERAVQPGLLGREPLSSNRVIAPNVRALFCQRTLRVSASEPTQPCGRPSTRANDGLHSRCHNVCIGRRGFLPRASRSDGPS